MARISITNARIRRALDWESGRVAALRFALRDPSSLTPMRRRAYYAQRQWGPVQPSSRRYIRRDKRYVRSYCGVNLCGYCAPAYEPSAEPWRFTRCECCGGFAIEQGVTYEARADVADELTFRHSIMRNG